MSHARKDRVWLVRAGGSIADQTVEFVCRDCAEHEIARDREHAQQGPGTAICLLERAELDVDRETDEDGRVWAREVGGGWRLVREAAQRCEASE